MTESAFTVLANRPLRRIFISAGEPSGDVHGANLIRAMARLHPNVEFVGYGGDRMAAAGCQILYPLCQLAVMGIWRVLAKVGALSPPHRGHMYSVPAPRPVRDALPTRFPFWISRRLPYRR